ncbi:MAG: D-arabinono-1,4-lactone oxidase [Chitinophagales bacterium]
MKNWSGYIEYHPETIAYPESESAVQQIVLKALEQRKTIRIIGSGHSFTPLFKTKQTLISLDKYQGLVEVDKDKCQATVKAGTKLRLLGDLLFREGMAMENLGDIDVQSIGGTISTSTHGTGLQLGTISTQVVALKFVNGKGEIVSCSKTKNPELFKAAQVSLGTLGILTQITLQCVPAYRLKMQNRNEALADVLNSIDQRNRDNRNFEFYWMPHTEKTWTKTSNIAESEANKVSWFSRFSDSFIENYGFMALAEYAYRFPSKNAWVANFGASTISNFDKVYHSHKIYATERLVKFHEMEYNIPIEAHKDVLKEVIRTFKNQKFPINFPIENRFVKGDNMYLSPAYGRHSAYIAFHTYHKKDPLPFFKVMEDICRAYNGRPHWGKMNTLTAKDVHDLYPKFDVFLKHQAKQDPEGIFVSPYFRELFGL